VSEPTELEKVQAEYDAISIRLRNGTATNVHALLAKLRELALKIEILQSPEK
jgi:hypothetical protein